MMKPRTFISVLGVLTLLTACGKKSPADPGETISITGDWKLTGITNSMNDETETFSEAELNDSGQVWDLTFNTNNTFEQTSNMAGDGIMSTHSGVYSTSGNHLTLPFTSIAGIPPITYDYSVTASELNLTRSFLTPYGMQTVIGLFRRKSST